MSRCVSEGHCITCGDIATSMRVLDAAPGTGLAMCADESGEQTLVDVTLLEGVAGGERVLVHAGVALTRIEEAPA